MADYCTGKTGGAEEGAGASQGPGVALCEQRVRCCVTPGQWLAAAEGVGSSRLSADFDKEGKHWPPSDANGKKQIQSLCTDFYDLMVTEATVEPLSITRMSREGGSHVTAWFGCHADLTSVSTLITTCP